MATTAIFFSMLEYGLLQGHFLAFYGDMEEGIPWAMRLGLILV